MHDHHTPEETTQWTFVHSAKARANGATASTARAKAKGSKDSKDSTDRSKDKNTDAVELWKARTLLERLLEQEEHQRWFEGKTQTQECTCSQS